MRFQATGFRLAMASKLQALHPGPGTLFCLGEDAGLRFVHDRNFAGGSVFGAKNV